MRSFFLVAYNVEDVFLFCVDEVRLGAFLFLLSSQLAIQRFYIFSPSQRTGGILKRFFKEGEIANVVVVRRGRVSVPL